MFVDEIDEARKEIFLKDKHLTGIIDTNFVKKN